MIYFKLTSPPTNLSKLIFVLCVHVLILVEGETELEMVEKLATRFFPKRSKLVQNLRGNFNINRKILDKITGFAQSHPGKKFSVCVYVDQERLGVPPVNWQLLDDELNRKGLNPVIVPVIAELMIESQFFADIDGIYAFLRAPRAQRKPKNFQNFRTLTHRELSALFRKHGKQYVKGHRTANFVANLDVEKIAAKCEELQKLIDHCS